MNTQSFISHRMFVAALSGGQRSHTPPPGPPLQVHLEAAPSPAASVEEKRRREAVSAIALRQMLSSGSATGY